MPLDLGYVYTDRMRVHVKTPGPRVMGEPTMFEVASGWTACRVSPATGKERRDAGRKITEYSHTMICGFTDTGGLTVTIREQDRIEIQSGPIPFTPNGMFEVTSVMIPRDLTQELLQVIQLAQRKEY